MQPGAPTVSGCFFYASPLPCSSFVLLQPKVSLRELESKGKVSCSISLESGTLRLRSQRYFTEESRESRLKNSFSVAPWSKKWDHPELEVKRGELVRRKDQDCDDVRSMVVR